MNPSRLILIVIVLLFVSCCRQESGKIIGIKIYDYNGDYNALAATWKDMGINTSFVSSDLAENEEFRAIMEKNNIRVFIIFPVFQNPEILKQDSTLYAITNKGSEARDSWVEFVCPSRESYRKAKTGELGDMISRLKPDGISIDFIRHFVFWEMIYPDRDPGSIERACFCDSCLAQFSSRQGIHIPDSCQTTEQKAGWITDQCRDSWDTFRCGLITSMVMELTLTARQISPEITIGIHAVPWREEDLSGSIISVAGQELGEISSLVDYISPMCYSHMLKRDAAWIADVVKEMDKRAPGKLLPSIQVHQAYIDQPFTAEDFRECLVKALEYPSRGVVFFSWPLFEKDSARMDIVKQVVDN